MTNHKIQFLGTPCGQHGAYTFYKAFKYSLHGRQKILTLGEFFFVKIWEEEDIISVGEAQLLWEDKSSGQILVSLRLYFLPENTPEGRGDEHGEHEVVSLAEKIILRADDVINIMRAASGVKWEIGMKGIFGSLSSPDPLSFTQENVSVYIPPIAESLDIGEILREKSLIGDIVEPSSTHVIILAYNSYCRMRGLLKRLEGVNEEVMRWKVVKALGGFFVPSKKTRLLYCKDVFDYPELEGHELLCNHLAPKLQGRPRKKKRRSDSESESSETSEEQRSWLKAKPTLLAKPNSLIRAMNKQHSTHNKFPSTPSMKSTNQLYNDFSTPAINRLLEVDFMTKLYKFMKERNTPINRAPTLGSKQLNVFTLFTRVQQLSGYENVCQKKLWKQLYEEICGKPLHHSHQLAAMQTIHTGSSVLRKNYERLLLPYENFMIQQQKRIYSQKRSNNKQQRRQLQQLQQLQVIEQHQSKEDLCEPSVSILQPALVTPIGASFQVADGGSTTITLIPVSDEQPVSQPTFTNSGTNSSSERSSPTSFGRTGSPTFGELSIPKVQVKKEHSLSLDIAKRPEITITPIPRSSGSLGSTSYTPLQLADLISVNANLNSPFGVTALQDLAKIAERYEQNPGSEQHHHKRFKFDDVGGRLNGTSSQTCGNSGDDHSWESGADMENKCGLPVPDLVSADLLRHLSMLDSNSKLLLPAHQSTKTINAIASLLPQTTIFPAPAPAAHQHIRQPSQNFHLDSLKPEPVFQSQSVYSQSKHVYGEPTTPVKGQNTDRFRNSSPEIEILDLRMPTESRYNNTRNDRLEIELLDLSTRKDITVSAVCKPGPSKNSSVSRMQQPSVSINSVDNNLPTGFCSPPIPPPRISPVPNPNNQPHPLLAALAVQGLSSPAALANLGMSSPSLLQYLMSSGAKPGTTSPPQGVAPLPYFSMMDPASMAAYYSLFPPGFLPQPNPSVSVSSNSPSNNAAVAAAAQQAASIAHLAHLSSLGLTATQNLPPEAMASLGIFKNYLPSGGLPPPHFLSGLMSPGSASNHPPNK